jgi:hypothetical protein
MLVQVCVLLSYKGFGLGYQPSIRVVGQSCWDSGYETLVPVLVILMMDSSCGTKNYIRISIAGE